MKYSSLFSKVAFFLIIATSIPKIVADTNEVIKNDSPEQVQSLKEADFLQALAKDCKEKAEHLMIVMGSIVDLNAAGGVGLMNALNPVLSICTQVGNSLENPSTQELYATITNLTYCTNYLNRLLDLGIDKVGEFLPEPPSKDIDNKTLPKEWDNFGTAFAALAKKIIEAEQDLWGTALMHVKTQMNQLDKILGDINTNIANSPIVNKADIKKEIMDLRNILHQFQKGIGGATANPSLVMDMHSINKAIINYLQDCQKHKFRKWINFDVFLEKSQLREEPAQSSQEALFRIMATNQELVQLEKDSESIDLSFGNKATRFLDDYILTPIERYDLDFYGAFLLCFGIGGAYYFDDYFFSDENCLFRKWVGFPDKKLLTEDDQGRTIAVDRKHKPVKAFGKLEKFLRDQYYVTYPIGAYLTTHFMNGLKEKWARIRPDIYRKIKVWFTKAKGGSFIKLSEKIDRISSSSVTFADVIGHEYEKSLIYPFIKYIKDPERWDARELTPPTGILLTGPTRSGKTFFAKAICGELSKQMASDSIRFISIDAHDIKANGIQTWMALAKAVAPCVIFIDEIDLLGLQRNQDKTMLSDFLQALSGIADNDPKKKVIVIGTTNKPENIDHALIQSGRLALEIRFKYPNLKERVEYIRKQLDKFAINPEAFDIDVDRFAREMEGRSFEDIKLVIDSAFIHVGIKGDIISQEILEWSLDTQLRKIIDIDTKEISDSEKRTLAAHFAGQVLTQILLNMEEQIAKVTIHQVVVKVKEESVYDQYYQQTKQTGLEQGALFTYLPSDTLDIKNQDEMLKKAKTLLGARIAERIVTNTCSTAYGWKKNSAFNMLKAIVADGIDLKSLSKNGQNAISDETLAKLKRCEAEVEQLLLAHKETLIALTDALQHKQILTFNQITKIIEQIEGKRPKNMHDTTQSLHTVHDKQEMPLNATEYMAFNNDDAEEDDEEAEPALI